MRKTCKLWNEPTGKWCSLYLYESLRKEVQPQFLMDNYCSINYQMWCFVEKFKFLAWQCVFKDGRTFNKWLFYFFLTDSCCMHYLAAVWTGQLPGRKLCFLVHWCVSIHPPATEVACRLHFILICILWSFCVDNLFSSWGLCNWYFINSGEMRMLQTIWVWTEAVRYRLTTTTKRWRQED